MELALNVTWLLLAATSLGVWARSRPDSRAGQRRGSAWLRELGALSYALVLLFPVISLTDDLHAEAVVLEESRSSRRTLKGGNDRDSSSGPSRLSGPPATVTFQESVFFRSQIIGWVSSTQTPLVSTLLAHFSAGRAPPFPG